MDISGVTVKDLDDFLVIKIGRGGYKLNLSKDLIEIITYKKIARNKLHRQIEESFPVGLRFRIN